MKEWCVYQHISPSKKVYIGITSDLKTRWEGYGCNYKSSNKFYNAIKKYGWNNISHKVLFKNLNKISAELIEIDLIYYYKQKNISYNITDGGGGTTGYRLSDEQKKRISLVHIGNKYSLGRKQPKEEKKRRADTIRGQKRTPETCKKLSDSSKKKVYQYDRSGEFIRQWDSALDADINLGISRSKIGACCLGHRNTAGGYIWSFRLETINIEKHRNKQSRQIIQCDTETNKKIIYESFAEACRKTKISKGRLNKYIKNGINHENHIWYEYS